MSEIYDNASVEALISGIVAYAEGIGANMLELRQACKAVMLSCDKGMAARAAELQGEGVSYGEDPEK
jgi:hypothetical protein